MFGSLFSNGLQRGFRKQKFVLREGKRGIAQRFSLNFRKAPRDFWRDGNDHRGITLCLKGPLLLENASGSLS